jgi:hypothetical protein
MAIWFERACGPCGIPLALVYLELVVALSLLATILHFRSLKKTREELAAVQLYFLAFFILLLVAPIILTILTSNRPASLLSFFGWTFGQSGWGLAITAAGLPLTVLAGFIGSRDIPMQSMYPLAKAACADIWTFARYEISYIILYYLPWEFLFRGVLFLPLVPAIGLIPALAIETTVSTLFHIGHPNTEVFASVGAGLAFGAIACITGSFFYTFILHAATGVATDTFLFLHRRPAKP